jgi:hypothetical protein
MMKIFKIEIIKNSLERQECNANELVDIIMKKIHAMEMGDDLSFKIHRFG